MPRIEIAESPANLAECLSPRGQLPTQELAGYIPVFLSQVLPNLYHESTNKQGVVNLGVAENKTCQRMLQKRFEACKVAVPDDLMGYNDFSGWIKLRQAFANVLQKYVFVGEDAERTSVDPDRLILTNGCTSAVCMLGRVLSDGESSPRDEGVGAPRIHAPGESSGCSSCLGGLSRLLGSGRAPQQAREISAAGQGKKIMYVGPRYPGFRADLKGFSGVETVEVTSAAGPQTFPTLAELQACLDAQPKNSVVAFLLCNPENPTGICWPRKSLLQLVEFCRKNCLYVIADEVYGAGVWGEPRFKDGTTRRHESLWRYADCTLWGLSKDFGCSGARCGVIYVRENPQGDPEDLFLKTLQTQNFLHALPNIAQVVLEQVLSDTTFMEAYLAACRASMRQAADLVQRNLQTLGIPFVDADGAMFLWADFSEFGIESNELFKLLVDEYKVFLTPGAAFSDVGNRRKSYEMRICFGACHTEALNQGLAKLGEFARSRRAAR